MQMWKVKRTAAETAAHPIPPADPAASDASAPKALDRNLRLKVSIHRALLDRINLSALEQLSHDQIQSEIGELVAELLEAQRELLNARERQSLIEEVLDELLGLGPLEPLLKDDSITDILVNGFDASSRRS